MLNPMMKMLSVQSSNNNILSTISAIKNGNSNILFEKMLKTNPQFQQFIQQNQGKSPEQIAQEHGININDIKNLF